MSYPVFQLNLAVSPFPTGWDGDLNEYAQELVSLITATLSGSILFGLYNPGLPFPTSDQGPIFQSGQLYLWNSAASAYVIYNAAAAAYARSPSVLDNADFQINQRLTAGTTANVAALTTTTTVPSTFNNFVTDRWTVLQDGTLSTAPIQSVVSAGPLTGGQDHPNTINCLRIQAGGSAISSLTASQFLIATQRIELQRARILFDVTPSISVWLRASVPGNYGVFLQSANASESIVFSCAVTVANTWQKFSFPAILTIPYSLGGFGTNPTDWSMTFGVCIASGGNFQATPAQDGTWLTATRYTDTNQTNMLATAGATLDVTLPQVEPASTVSSFEFKDFRTSLMACQRMWCKSYDYSVVPGTALGFIDGVSLSPGGTNFVSGYAPFPVQMRLSPFVLDNEATPVITSGILVWDPWSGTVNDCNTNNSSTKSAIGGITHGVAAVVGLNNRGFTGFASGGLALSAMYTIEFVANAEL